MERQIQLEDVLATTIAGAKASMYISMPAAVVSYDHVAQTADCQPMLTDPRFDITTGEPIFEPWGIIKNIPVMWPRMGGYVIAGFLKPNDQVVLEAFDLDPSAWRMQTPSLTPANPQDLRRLGGNHWRVNPCDLTAPGGKGPNQSAPTSPGLVIGLDGGTPLIEINGSTIKLGHGATSFVALATLVSGELTKISALLAAGLPVAAGKATGVYTPGPVAATVAKAL